MALTNAERQRRYRQKLKARASGEAAGDLVRAMVERAVALLWRIQANPAPAAEGPEDALIIAAPPGADLPGADPAGTPPQPPSLAAFRAGLARHPASLLALCRATLAHHATLAPEERALLASLLEIEAALRLTPAKR